MTRRLLTYICIDTSGSMRGEPIEAVNAGLQALLASLRQNPYALESVHLTITTFDSQIKDVLPLTPLEQVVLPESVCPESGAAAHLNTSRMRCNATASSKAANKKATGAPSSSS